MPEMRRSAPPGQAPEKLEFDLKDYPVIFFKGMKELKDAHARARSVARTLRCRYTPARNEEGTKP